MPPKGVQQQPHRGTRAGYKSRKKTFYEAQDIVQQATYDTFGVWLSKRTYDRLTQEEIDLVCEFVLLDERPIEHEIWDRIGRFYREVSAAIGRARRGAEEAARAPESGEGAAAASSEPSAPSKAAAPKQQPKPQAAKPKAAPKLGISGPTKDLYFPSRRDPLRRRRAPEEEREEEDTSGRPASEPRQRHRSSHTSRGFPRGVAVHPLSDSGEEGSASQGAAPGAPARPRAPPAKRPFERGEVVEAEVHPPPLQRRRPQGAQRVPRQPVLPERSRPQRVVPEAVDGELEGEARQARARTRSPKPKVRRCPRQIRRVSPIRPPLGLLLRLPLRQTLRVPRTHFS